MRSMDVPGRHELIPRQRLPFVVTSFLLIVSLLAVAAAVGYAAKLGDTLFRLAIVGVIGLTGLLLLYRIGRMELGILAVVPIATLVNFFTLPTGSASRLVLSLVLSIALVGFWFVRLLSPRFNEEMKPSAITAPILLFSAVNIFAFLWSEALHDPTLLEWDHYLIPRLGGMAVNILLPLFALFVANQIEDLKWLKWITYLFLGVSAFIVVSAIFHLPFNRLYDNGYRGLFGTWAGALAYSLALYDNNLGKWKRAALLAVAGAWVFHHFYQHGDWFSGWVPLLGAMAVISWLRSRKLFFAFALVGLVIFIWKYDYFYQNYFVQNFYKEGGNERLGLWMTNFNLILRHPLFGVGPAGYAPYYMTYNPTDARSTHNNFFDVLAQTGVVGSVIFFWMMAAFAAVGKNLLSQVKGKYNFIEAYSAAALGGLAGALASMMLGDWVIPFAYNQTISGVDNAIFTWLFLGGLVAISHILKTNSALADIGEK